jgi:hypothetical protein
MIPDKAADRAENAGKNGKIFVSRLKNPSGVLF